jgi:hypothetical protein
VSRGTDEQGAVYCAYHTRRHPAGEFEEKRTSRTGYANSCRNANKAEKTRATRAATKGT